MKIYVETDCEIYNVHCGEIYDSDEIGCPLTIDQMDILINLQYATTDMDKNDTRHLAYQIGKIYECKANVINFNALWQLKDGITSSDIWVESEWDKLLQGVV